MPIQRGFPRSLGFRDSHLQIVLDSIRGSGFDRESVIADPKFVDRAGGDYRVREDSPAWDLGFVPLPLDEIGLYESPDRASWPVDSEPGSPRC